TPESAADSSYSPEDPPKPRVMDSAERRTEEDDPASGSLSPSSSQEEDDLLFFPRSGPGSAEPAAEEHRPAAAQPEFEFARERDPRRGGRPGGGPRRGPGRPGMGRPKPLIQDIFKRGQEVLVQVIKEGIGTKGPTLSTYISIAGRYLVLMPGLNRIGVSRKI